MRRVSPATFHRILHTRGPRARKDLTKLDRRLKRNIIRRHQALLGVGHPRNRIRTIRVVVIRTMDVVMVLATANRDRSHDVLSTGFG